MKILDLNPTSQSSIIKAELSSKDAVIENFIRGALIYANKLMECQFQSINKEYIKLAVFTQLNIDVELK